MASEGHGKPARPAVEEDDAKYLLGHNQFNGDSCSVVFHPDSIEEQQPQQQALSHASLLLTPDRGAGLQDLYHNYSFTNNDSLGASSGFTFGNEGICGSSSGLTFELVLGTLSMVQENVQQLQSIVRAMAHGRAQQQILPEQQLIMAAGFTSIISDLVMASSDLLQNSPSIQDHEDSRQYLNNSCVRFNGTRHQDGMGKSVFGSLEGFMVNGNDNSFFAHGIRGLGSLQTNSPVDQNMKVSIEHGIAVNSAMAIGMETEREVQEGSPTIPAKCSKHEEDLDLLKDNDENGDGETLETGSFQLVEMDATKILAEHAHFCDICGKGFKRDANLRMHMRGHGDEYKTPAALARPDKSSIDNVGVKVRRFSCPYVGCKRNKQHPKFQPLKTMLCVKNHYRRSHCPKMFTCSKCKSRHFSVLADLKTHEKHCGQCKWRCSCGTTFSRKDKLFGHISLFTGHTPATPVSDGDGDAGGVSHLDTSNSMLD